MKSVDILLFDVWESLCRDLQSTTVASGSTRSIFLDDVADAARRRDLQTLRTLALPGCASELDPNFYKALIQARDFGKRWVFEDDVKDLDELEAYTHLQFQCVQDTVISELPTGDENLEEILDCASERIQAILGEYSQEEHKGRCRFGAKAAYGLPKKNAYLHERLRQLSSTAAQKVRFSGWLKEDFQLSCALNACKGDPDTTEGECAVTDHLVLTAVPKTWKISRAIVPDTVLGGYVSAGLGDIFAEKLRVNAGLDIRRKQEEHRKLAQLASTTGHLTTADLSSASDMISWALLQRVLPPSWLNVIGCDTTHSVRRWIASDLQSGNKVYEVSRVNSPMLMGKGYTFPLQTLVFYSLLQAIAAVQGADGSQVSVYGDDLIYPTKMHSAVMRIFSLVGMVVNADKTFSQRPSNRLRQRRGCFRESCGGDYLCGQDVRPYSVKGISEETPFTRKEDRAGMVYTILNGLLSRWEWWEIRTTVRLLLIEAHNALDGILCVPALSGVKTGLVGDDLGCSGWLSEIENFITDVPVLTTEHWIPTLRYNSLRESQSYLNIDEIDETVYMWDNLRVLQPDDEVLQQETSLRVNRLLGVPGYRAEAIRMQVRSEWDTIPEVIFRRRRKAYITKDNVVHRERPSGQVYQICWVETSEVVCRDRDAVICKVDKTKVLYTPRLTTH